MRIEIIEQILKNLEFIHAPIDLNQFNSTWGYNGDDDESVYIYVGIQNDINEFYIANEDGKIFRENISQLTKYNMVKAIKEKFHHIKKFHRENTLNELLN